ncbi:MAG: rRNA adenine N-6-methyltransferase family protein, partial [Bacteriovoracaceae bacterium]
PPKVDSVVLSFTRKAKPEIALDSFKKFEEFCRILFSNRRKQVGKVLKSKYEKERIERAFQKCGLELTRRAETFTQEEVCSVYKEFHGN